MELFDTLEEPIQVQEEPALEIALPQVFEQPPLVTLQRGKLAYVERLAARLNRAHATQNGSHGLGPEYQELVNEFQPLFTWAMACWDFLLSTEGCRFLPRHGDEKLYSRGDYRVVTDRDFSRLVHRVFRQCVLDFAQLPLDQSLTAFLRAHFWEAVVRVYRKLAEPSDPRQRHLTAYSYLRCIPYEFLNVYHHELVAQTIERLPASEQSAIRWYFLHFFTVPAAAQAMQRSDDELAELLRLALTRLLIHDRLVYCLLRQIERY